MEENKKDLEIIVPPEKKNIKKNSHKNSPKKTKEKENLEDNEKEINIGNYLIKKTLGKGTFGKVKLGIYLPKNKKVAIKILEKKRLKEEDDIIRLKREFEMLSQFTHPNVISVSEIFETNEAYFTVMEFCEGGELFNYIVEHKRLSEEKSAFFYYQLINGLEYIHSMGIVHRDLKPENLLLTEDNILKIIDFGLSNYFKQDQCELLETPCGSPCYASPEMLSGENYDGFKIDIWATGIILFAMLCGFLPFDHKDNDKLFMKILECKIQYPKNLSKESKDLIKRTLVPDPRKRITISEIKKHPFYLKGKEIFDNNFTIYQVSQEENSDSDDSTSFNYYTLENNLFFYDYNHKSEVLSNKLKIFYFNNLKKKRYNSYEINNRFISNNTIKKLVNFEKEIKKMKKRSKKEKNKLKENNNNKNDYHINAKKKLKRCNSAIYQINGDICTFCENLIEKYKKEEKDKINKIIEQNKIIKNKDITINSNRTNQAQPNRYKLKQKFKTNKILLNNIEIYNNINNNIEKINELNAKIEKTKKLNKENEKKIREINHLIIKKEQNSIKNNTIINPHTKKILNQNINRNHLKNDIKVNIKKPIKINKLYINNNRILKLNKLPQNIKLKKYNRKLKSTSNNNSKMKNFKNILDIIKQQPLKTSINIINKQNIIHHHTTNITNMTQKNYFSNVIINNFKANDHKNYSISQQKEKANLDISEIQNENDKNIINDYLKKNNLQRLNLPNKSNNWKLKNNLQKEILKEDILVNKFTKNKNSIDSTNLGSREEEKFGNILTIREKKKTEIPIIDTNEINDINESKTIPNTNDKLRSRYKAKLSNLNTYNINNNLKYTNTNKNTFFNNSENSLNSFGFSLLSANNLDFMNDSKREKDNKHLNTCFYRANTTNIANSVEPISINTNNNLYRKKKLDKLLTNNINLNLNLEEKINRNKINNSSIDNIHSNRSYNNNYNYNKSNYIINTINNNTNMLYNIAGNYVNNLSTNKKIENIKKNNLYGKSLNTKKYPKLNLKELLGIENSNKNETIYISTTYKNPIQTQRNKPSIMAKTQKNIGMYKYINSFRNNENKISNTSYNIDSIEANHPMVNPLAKANYISNIGKFKANQSNMRNKDLININLNLKYNKINKSKNNNINMTSDNIKINTNLLKKKNYIYNNKTINTIGATSSNKTNQNIILNKNIINKNRMNSNNFLDKYVESKKLFSSLRKRINFKSNLINNNNYPEEKIQTKIKDNSIKIKELENRTLKNNSLFANYTKRQFLNNNTLDIKSNINYNNLINLKKNHKKIKSMKDAVNAQKNKNSQNKINSFIFNEDTNRIKNSAILNSNVNLNELGLYICNTDGNSINAINNNLNILDNKFNSINNYRRPQQIETSNINNLKRNNIIKKMKINQK